MSQVLGRVIGRELDGPRGPDVAHRVRVPQDWIDDAAVIEVELPRHLHCAVCEGGGCDLCDRSGAHTLRSRGEPAEIVEVTLPRRDQERRDDQEKGPGSSSTPISRSFVIRIPELGGLPPEGSELPRGHLLLTVAPAPTPDTGVKLVERLPVPETASTALAAPAPPPRKRSGVQRVLLVLLAVLAWIALLIYLRLSGLA
jgi:hypothetical protein